MDDKTDFQKIKEEMSKMSEEELSELITDDGFEKTSDNRSDHSENEESTYIGDEDKEDSFGEVQPDTRTDEEIAEEDRKLRAQSYKIAANLGNFGMFLIIALIFGYVIGRWMDGFFGTKPVFMVFWICCAVAASILELVKNIKKAQKLGDK